MLTRVPVAVVLSCLVVLGACDRGPDRLSAEELRERANAACRDANGRIADLPGVAGDDPMRAADHLEAVSEVQHALRDELGALHPPSDVQEVYDAWLDGVDAALAATDDVAEALRAGDPDARSEALGVAVPAAAAADEAAATLRVDECRPAADDPVANGPVADDPVADGPVVEGAGPPSG